MSTDRVLKIIVEHTSAARLASECAHNARVADTEEQAQIFIARKEFYKKRIEELREERIKLLGN